MPRCIHCKKRKINRPRGLCWGCYYAPGVRDLYPPTSKFARHGVEDRLGQVPLPPLATNALPGSVEKMAVLAQRAAMRVSLWHPDDALPDRRLAPKEAG
jgi:hypothetical protein